MAVQARLCPENLGLPSSSSSVCGLLQDWTVVINPDDRDRLCFGLQQQQALFQQQYEQGVQLQNLAFDCNFNNQGFEGSHNFLSAAFSRTLCAQLEKQRQEIECLLQIQSERLRSVLQQQRNQELAVLFNGLESKALSLMRQKDDDLAQATKRAIFLSDYLRRAETESESWQRLAKEREAMVVDLNNAIEKVKERPEDAHSCCGSSINDDQEIDRLHNKIKCKNCNTKNSSVLFLPCRHICSCKSCEALLSSCPVCESPKEAIMEVLFA